MMIKYWWQLPGPAKFISNIIENLRDGKNIILCLPEYSPEGLYTAIYNSLGENNEWHWYKLDAGKENYKNSLEIVHFLFLKFAPDTDTYKLRNIKNLINQDSFCGKLIWVDNLNSTVWPFWKEFLIEYEHACRNKSLFDRTLFCVPLNGLLAMNPPKEEVCTAHHVWKNMVSYFDMLLFTLYCFQSKRIKGMEKKLAIAITASIALWDPLVAERLAEKKLETILEPLSLLQDIARERGWNNNDCKSEISYWYKGMIDEIDGEKKIHSAAIAFNDPYKEIERRIWNAEAGIILPFIEECRRKILENFSGLLELPFVTRYGEVINELCGLEIGHIEAQIIKNDIKIDSKIKKYIRILREGRNNISHLMPIKSELLINKDGILNIRF